MPFSLTFQGAVRNKQYATHWKYLTKKSYILDRKSHFPVHWVADLPFPPQPVHSALWSALIGPLQLSVQPSCSRPLPCCCWC